MEVLGLDPLRARTGLVQNFRLPETTILGPCRPLVRMGLVCVSDDVQPPYPRGTHPTLAAASLLSGRRHRRGLPEARTGGVSRVRLPPSLSYTSVLLQFTSCDDGRAGRVRGERNGAGSPSLFQCSLGESSFTLLVSVSSSKEPSLLRSLFTATCCDFQSRFSVP